MLEDLWKNNNNYLDLALKWYSQDSNLRTNDSII